MKKIYFILTLVVISFMMVFADDTVKILRIYHDGTFTAIPLANIDSIYHTTIDGSSNWQTVIEAIDSTRCIPISEIDSVVVTEADIEEFNTYIKNIEDYISTQGEIEIGLFQKNLMTWLNNQIWVYQTAISDAKDIITITFLNGKIYYIVFQNTSFFEDYAEDYENQTRRSDDENDNFWNVSTCDGEVIVDEPYIIYYNCLPGHLLFTMNVYNTIEEKCQSSPLDIKVEKGDNYADLKRNFSKYGIVIISNTHGASDWRNGAFKIVEKYNPDGEIIYYNALGERIISEEPIKYKWVFPKELSSYLGISSPIVYGDYCWGYWISNQLKCPVVGYDNWSNYIENKKRVKSYINNMVNGETHENAMDYLTPYILANPDQRWYEFLPDITCNTLTNKKELKMRYFSIKTDNITGNGITGEIRGFDNLKDEVKKNSAYKLYVHEGSDTFTPESSGVKVISNVVKVKSDGTFSVSDDELSKYGSSGFIVGFEYAGKVYYGEPKWMPEISVSIEDISPICDDYYFTIRGKVNGLENLKYVDVSLDVCKCNKTISDYELDIDYSNFQYEDYKSYNADLDKDNGNIVCRVPRAIGVTNYYDANTIYGFTFVIEKRSEKFYSDTKYCIWKLCPDNNHPHTIDLGLSNDIKWACCNVGSINPENQGGYYAWGETKQKGVYFYDTYEYYEEKIGESDYIHIGNNISGSSYDAARANWGTPWRMPTAKEFNLLDECVHVDATINGMDGVKVIGPNGNSIFIPCAGKMWKNEKQEFGNWGYYWTSILQRGYTDWWHMYYEEQFAYYASVTAPFISVSGMPSGERIEGLSVRPVCNGDTPIDLCLSENNLNMNILDNQIIDITSGSGEYTVSSSNPEVITANINCNEVEITANHAGTTTITVTDVQTGKTVKLTVTVVAAEELKLSTSNISLGVGGISTVNILSGYDTYTISNSNNDVVTATLSGTSIIIKAVAEGTAIITITDAQSGQTATIGVTVTNSDGSIAYRACPDENHPHMIDLGLPSGTKWACCNVGAKAPEEYGGYYAWGETSEKDKYDWSNYIFCDGSENTCQNIGSVISGKKYDVASVLWGAPWMMPTYSHLEELTDMDICTSEEAVVNGVDGRKFTGPNGSSIFFPFAGSYYSSWNSSKGLEGFYWTGTLSEFADWYTYYLHIEGGTSNASWRFASRSSGLSVRPVCN